MLVTYYILFGISVFGSSSFLIDQSTPSNPVGAGQMADKKYYTLLSMISELNTFTRKLQKQMTKLSNSVEKIESSVSQGKQEIKNETEEIRLNYMDMTKQFIQLQIQQGKLEKELIGTNTDVQQIANATLTNNMYISECENRTNNLEQNILASNYSIQSLKILENITSDEFRSIYSRTLKAEQVVKDIQTNMTLNPNIMQSKKKVAITSCTQGGNFGNASLIDFTEVKSTYGLNKVQIEDFKKDRKFSCRVPGLYFITVHIMSSSISATYRIVKNDTIDLGRVEFTPNRDYGWQNWHTGSGSAVTWLNTKETLGIQVWGNKMYIGSFSCMSIVQMQ